MRHLCLPLIVVCLLLDGVVSQSRSQSRYTPSTAEEEYEEEDFPPVRSPPTRRVPQRRQRQQLRQSQPSSLEDEEPVRISEPDSRRQRRPPKVTAQPAVLSYRESPPEAQFQQNVVPQFNPESEPQQARRLPPQRHSPSEQTQPNAYQPPLSETRPPLPREEPPRESHRRRGPSRQRRPQNSPTESELEPEKPRRAQVQQRTRSRISALVDDDQPRSQIFQEDRFPQEEEDMKRLQLPRTLPGGHRSRQITDRGHSQSSQSHRQLNSNRQPVLEHQEPPVARRPVLQQQPRPTVSNIPVDQPDVPHLPANRYPIEHDAPQVPTNRYSPGQQDEPELPATRYPSHQTHLPINTYPNEQQTAPLPVPTHPTLHQEDPHLSTSRYPTEEENDYVDEDDHYQPAAKRPIDQHQPSVPSQYQPPIRQQTPPEVTRQIAPHRQSQPLAGREASRQRSPSSGIRRDVPLDRQTPPSSNRYASQQRQPQSTGSRHSSSTSSSSSSSQRLPEPHLNRQIAPQNPQPELPATRQRLHSPGESEVRLPPTKQPFAAPDYNVDDDPERVQYAHLQHVSEIQTPVPTPYQGESGVEQNPGYSPATNRLPIPSDHQYQPDSPPRPAVFPYSTDDSEVPRDLIPINAEPIPPNRHSEAAPLPHENTQRDSSRTLRPKPASSNRRQPEDLERGRGGGGGGARSRSESHLQPDIRQSPNSEFQIQRSSRPPKANQRDESRSAANQQSRQLQRNRSRYQPESTEEESRVTQGRQVRPPPPQGQYTEQDLRPHLSLRSRPQYDSEVREQSLYDTQRNAAAEQPPPLPSYQTPDRPRPQRTRTPSQPAPEQRNVNQPPRQNYAQPPPRTAAPLQQPQQRPRQEQQQAASPAPRQSSQSKFRCPEPYGFFADAHQCDRYYECRNGSVVEGMCPDGLAFNDYSAKYLRCDSLRDVDCSSRPELQPAQSTKNCPRRFGLYPHESDCTKFWNCVDGASTEIKCPPGLVYHDARATCDWADLVENSCNTEELLGFTCPEANAAELQDGVYATYPHPSDCRLHFACIKGADGQRRPRMLSCNYGLVFDPPRSQCERPENVQGCEKYYGSSRQQDAAPPAPPRETTEEPRQTNRRRRPSRRRQTRTDTDG